MLFSAQADSPGVEAAFDGLSGLVLEHADIKPDES